MIYFAVNLILVVLGYFIFTNTDIRQRIVGIKKGFHKVLDNKFIIVPCSVVFILSFIILRIIIKNSVAALALSILPAFCVYGVFDVISRGKERKEAGQITYFLMTMAKWSAVRNDIVFCLKKTIDAGMEKPMLTLMERTLARISGGMDMIKAFSLLEKESHSEDMRYLTRNIKFAAEKGGNLQKLFSGMEQQFFKIDEEIFKRKISTVRDRGAVYATIVMVLGTASWFMINNPAAGQFYLSTNLGNFLLLIFSGIFSIALIFMVRGQ